MTLKKIAIIPARGGSKRLPRKNVLPLAGKPLVVHAIEAAKASKAFDTIALLTDDPEIASIGHAQGVEVFHDHVASDTTGVARAVLRAMEQLEAHGNAYDIVGVMLPTCLFRKPEHIAEGMKMLDVKTDAVVAVSPFEFPVAKALRKKGHTITPHKKNSPLLTGVARTQDQETFYHDNGAFYIARWNSFKKNKNFYKGAVKGYEIHPLNAVDIDNEIDFVKAQLLLDFMKTDPDNPLRDWLSHIAK